MSVIIAHHFQRKRPVRAGLFRDYFRNQISTESRTLHMEKMKQIFIKMKVCRWGYNSPTTPHQSGEPVDCRKKRTKIKMKNARLLCAGRFCYWERGIQATAEICSIARGVKLYCQQ